ncbi:MAG: alginate lyase family protein [Bacteroidota bacterium]
MFKNNIHKYLLIVFTFTAVGFKNCGESDMVDVKSIDKKRIITAAEKYLNDEPVTVTSFKCERSSGGNNDFYSEGDYWWPDPENPNGPYIRKDGLTNPDNFTKHREAMREMSLKVAALVAAYKITQDKKYADAALKHLNAWFAVEDTKMNPHMLYAQAIKGRVTGRGIGIIDTIHLVEVAQTIIVLLDTNYITRSEAEPIIKWFEDYLNWLIEHPFGYEEKNNGNNHSTCYIMQAAEFAKLTGNEKVLQECRKFYKSDILPLQVEADGSFPKELKRTKPYGYSLFNMDAMGMVCLTLSTEDENLWEYETADGKSFKKAVEFMYPFIADKSKWNLPPDVMYHDEWPVRHPSLLFAGLAYNEEKYIELWKKLDPDSDVEEVNRNFPIRQPILWM